MQECFENLIKMQGTTRLMTECLERLHYANRSVVRALLQIVQRSSKLWFWFGLVLLVTLAIGQAKLRHPSDIESPASSGESSTPSPMSLTCSMANSMTDEFESCCPGSLIPALFGRIILLLPRRRKGLCASPYPLPDPIPSKESKQRFPAQLPQAAVIYMPSRESPVNGKSYQRLFDHIFGCDEVFAGIQEDGFLPIS